MASVKNNGLISLYTQLRSNSTVTSLKFKLFTSQRLTPKLGDNVLPSFEIIISQDSDFWSSSSPTRDCCWRFDLRKRVEKNNYLLFSWYMFSWLSLLWRKLNIMMKTNGSVYLNGKTQSGDWSYFFLFISGRAKSQYEVETEWWRSIHPWRYAPLMKTLYRQSSEATHKHQNWIKSERLTNVKPLWQKQHANEATTYIWEKRLCINEHFLSK